MLNEQGGAPASIDAVMREAGGFRMGPFELMDLIGHDVNFAVTESVFRAYFNDPRYTPSLIQQELVNAGFLGRKSGRGFYSYADGATPPRSRSPRDAPADVALYAQDGPAAALQARFAERIPGARQAGAHADDLLATAGRASIALTDGRTATERAAQTGAADLCWSRGARLRAGNRRADARAPVQRRGLCGRGRPVPAGGFSRRRRRGRAGHGRDAHRRDARERGGRHGEPGVCSPADLDLAMEKGVNYPCGPLAWADAIGIGRVHRVLSSLAASYGEDRYRVSPRIAALHAAGRTFRS